RQPGRRLTTAENQRVVRRRIVEQACRIELALGRAVPVHRDELRKIDAHHPGADRTAPALGGRRGRADSRIGKRLIGGSERETMRSVRELEELAIADGRRGIEML